MFFFCCLFIYGTFVELLLEAEPQAIKMNVRGDLLSEVPAWSEVDWWTWNTLFRPL